jgi:DNA-binding response OmpR family regulator
VGLFARDLWSADDGLSRALAALGVLAGLCGVLAALRIGRHSRPALVPPSEPPLAFEPVARPAAPGERRPAPERAPTTVLVIDGHDETRELLARGLAREGVHVITAADWEQGLRRARDVGPDLITLDALLPETDAWAMLRALKEDALTAQIPVIMTTLQSERGTGEATAAFDYLPLPFDPERLSSALRRYWPRHGDATVLVVAGDAALRNGLAELLGAQGWMVLEAESSRLGLQLLAGALPDVVVLELDAAGAQGPEFLAALRGQPAWSAIPVVAVGLREPSVEERQALEGRAPRVFQKSALSSHELARQIRGLLGRGSPPARRADAS